MPMCFCAIGCQYSTLNRLFGCVFLVWRHHLRKVNKSSVRSFRRFFSTIFLLFDVPQYSNRFDYIKDIRPAVYFNNQKSLHIIFKSRLSRGDGGMVQQKGSRERRSSWTVLHAQCMCTNALYSWKKKSHLWRAWLVSDICRDSTISH